MWTLLAFSCVPLAVSTGLIYMHLANYRKPFEQRFIVRILLMLPIFVVTTTLSVLFPAASVVIVTAREIYEAFIIYTFYQLLCYLLNGERGIISQNHNLTSHLFPLNYMLHDVNISDPYEFLVIKRGILQYVYLKPLICVLFLLSDYLQFGSLRLIANVIYNISMSVSLYQLAMFWKCNYAHLQQFNPWGKFLCIKLIIFVTYWQSLFVDLLVRQHPASIDANLENYIILGELVGFSFGHWYAFNYKEYQNLSGDCSRFPVLYALKDALGTEDLLYDIRTTMSSGTDVYNYRRFDSVEYLINSSNYKYHLRRFNEGLRVKDDGSRYWLGQHEPVQYGSLSDSASGTDDGIHDGINDDDEQLFRQSRSATADDINCPVVYDEYSHFHTENFSQLRQQVRRKHEIGV